MRSQLRGKRDSNHEEIAQTFRDLGCSVADTADLGNDFPDLVVGLVGVNLLVEVKSEHGQLEGGQERFKNEWRGNYHVVRTADEAIGIVQQVRRVAGLRG